MALAVLFQRPIASHSLVHSLMLGLMRIVPLVRRKSSFEPIQDIFWCFELGRSSLWLLLIWLAGFRYFVLVFSGVSTLSLIDPDFDILLPKNNYIYMFFTYT